MLLAGTIYFRTWVLFSLSRERRFYDRPLAFSFALLPYQVHREPSSLTNTCTFEILKET